MTWRVEIEWDGRRWAFEDVPIEQEYVADLENPTGEFTSTLRLDMGDTWGMRLAGHRPATLKAFLYSDGALTTVLPCIELQPGRRGEVSVLRLGYKPDRKASMVDSVRDFAVRRTDLDATAQARADARESWDGVLTLYGGKSMAELFPFGEDPYLEHFSHFFTDPTIYERQSDGAVLPVVFGRPGRNGEAALKLLVADDAAQRSIVAAHPMDVNGTVTGYRYQSDGRRYAYSGEDPNEIGANDVVISTGTFGPRTISQVDAATGTGDPLAYPDGWLSGDPEVQFHTTDEENNLFVAFNRAAVGLPNAAVDVLEQVASYVGGLPLDASSASNVREILTGYELDGIVTDSDISAWTLLTSELMPLLPVAISPGPAGLVFRGVVLSPTTVTRVRAEVTLGPDMEPLGPMSSAEASASRVALHYGYDLADEKFTRRVNLRPSDLGMGVSLLREPLKLETNWIYDDVTAGQVVRDLVHRRCQWLPRLTCLANPSLYGMEGKAALYVGDVVRITDASYGLNHQLASVVRLVRRGAELRLTFALLTGKS